MSIKTKREFRVRRHLRVRNKVRGSAERPRMAVYRSNKKLEVQFIDDDAALTLVGASSKGKNAEAAKELGARAAELAKSKGITKVVFDRGGYAYGANLKTLADSAREAGLDF